MLVMNQLSQRPGAALSVDLGDVQACSQQPFQKGEPLPIMIAGKLTRMLFFFNFIFSGSSNAPRNKHLSILK